MSGVTKLTYGSEIIQHSGVGLPCCVKTGAVDTVDERVYLIRHEGSEPVLSIMSIESSSLAHRTTTTVHSCTSLSSSVASVHLHRMMFFVCHDASHTQAYLIRFNYTNYHYDQLSLPGTWKDDIQIAIDRNGRFLFVAQ